MAKPPPGKRPKDVKGRLADVGYPAPQGDSLTTEKVKSEPADRGIQPAKPAKLPSRRLGFLLGDAAVLALTVLVAVVGGLSTFYFGKPWGTVEDYLTVIVVGLAAQTVLKAILVQLSLLVHDISPDRPTVAARLLPPAGAAAPASAPPASAVAS